VVARPPVTSESARVRRFIEESLLETLASVPLILRATAEIVPPMPGGVETRMRDALHEAAHLADRAAADGYVLPRDPEEIADFILGIEGHDPILIWHLGDELMEQLRRHASLLKKEGMPNMALKWAPVIRKLRSNVMV
jgi:hypothetical protein